MVQLSRIRTLQRTKRMLVREWNLSEEPMSTTALRKHPPAGLGKNDNLIRALEVPIETNDFIDVKAQVIGSDLNDAKTVGELRDKIWDGIKDAYKSLTRTP